MAVGTISAGRCPRPHFAHGNTSFSYEPCSANSWLPLSDNLRQEPGSSLGLVDPVLNQAGGGDVVVPLAKLMRRAIVQKQVVVTKVRTAHVPVEVLRLHIEREDVGKQLA